MGRLWELITAPFAEQRRIGRTLDVAWLEANLNSFGFDYFTRQKVQGNNLNWFIVEQLPVIARDGYDQTDSARRRRESLSATTCCG